MKIGIKWENFDIVTVIKSKGVYISNIDKENFDKAVEAGMPISILAEFKTVTKTLPAFIIERIPSKKLMHKTISELSDDESQNLLRFIDETNCKRETDKFSIHIIREEKDKDKNDDDEIRF